MNEQERSTFRAFVRENHPDRGGDPEVFVAGLARFGQAAPSASGVDGAAAPGTASEGRVGAEDKADERRFDAPVEVVTPMALPLRVAIALARTIRHQRNRRVQ